MDVATVARRARTENFPVASLLFPRRLRPHLRAVYGFARLVDILGDELLAGASDGPEGWRFRAGASDGGAGGARTSPVAAPTSAAAQERLPPPRPLPRGGDAGHRGRAPRAGEGG